MRWMSQSPQCDVKYPVVFQRHLVPVPSIMLPFLQQAFSHLHLNKHREKDSHFKIICGLNQAYCKISPFSLSLSQEMKLTKKPPYHTADPKRGAGARALLSRHCLRPALLLHSFHQHRVNIVTVKHVHTKLYIFVRFNIL